MLCEEDRVSIITKSKTYCAVKHKQHGYIIFFNEYIVSHCVTIKAFIGI